MDVQRFVIEAVVRAVVSGIVCVIATLLCTWALCGGFVFEIVIGTAVVDMVITFIIWFVNGATRRK